MSDGVSFQLGKMLVVCGVILVGAGLLVMLGSKFSLFGLGKLPGDVAYEGKNVTLHFPIVTCLVLSGALTLLLWLISTLTRK